MVSCVAIALNFPRSVHQVQFCFFFFSDFPPPDPVSLLFWLTSSVSPGPPRLTCCVIDLLCICFLHLCSALSLCLRWINSPYFLTFYICSALLWAQSLCFKTGSWRVFFFVNILSFCQSQFFSSRHWLNFIQKIFWDTDNHHGLDFNRSASIQAGVTALRHIELFSSQSWV